MRIMKRILGILLISSLLLISCKKDFLEIFPKSSLTIDQTFKTDKDFQDAIIGSYKEFMDFYKYYWELGDLPGDDTWQAAPRVQTRIRIDNFAVDVNDGILSNTWRDLYQVIERTNTLLAKGEPADVTVITNKDVYIAEAKLLRALAYFHLVRVFGDVPLMIKPVSVQDALITPKTSKEVIYTDVIIAGLLEAESMLPDKWDSKNVGRATKGAAKSLLGLVYLTTKDFSKAETKLYEVTQMGYELLPDFEDLFDFSNEHHKEYIFDIEYIDGNLGLDSPFTRTMLVETQDVGTPFRNALRALWNIQGPESGGGGTPVVSFISLFDPADQRQYRTATLGIFDVTGNWIPIPGSAAVPAICQKYTTSIITDGKTNWRVVRYADVLLMLAEAMNENDKTTEALTYLNMVRTRAGVPTYSGLTKDEARDKILLERRFELYMEGHRWFDLVRTGRALSTCSPLGMKEHMTIFPIPQTEIEVINDPSILPQNPGY
jgi:hypothetical protein